MATNAQAAFSSATVSFAAAYAITPRAIATWHPALVRTPRLMVPMELDALMVRNRNLTWAQCGMSTPSASATQPVPASSLIPKPFAQLAADQARPRGAYLQWYLPRAFTSATADSSATIFPPIPDRWLVVRLYTGRVAARRVIRGWVLQAGEEPARVFDLSSWTEPGTAPSVKNPLTALGHGDLSWAGYFDNVQNRLSFADTFLDADGVRGSLSYLVCGWFSDPTLDPLGDPGITTAAAFYAKLQQLGWTLPHQDTSEPAHVAQSYVTAAASAGLAVQVDARIAATQAVLNAPVSAQSRPWWPQSCILHGAVLGIDWPGANDTAEVGGPPASSAVTVVFGNTMAETMGAMVAQANSNPGEALIIEALQLGVLKQIDQPDGRAQVDVEVHANSFTSQPGLAATTEPLSIAPSGVMQAPPAKPATPGPGIFASQLTTKQLLPIEVLGVARASPVSMQVSTGQTHYVMAEESLVSGRMREVIAAAGLSLQPPLSDPGGERTVQRAMPRFYTPKDPIVLIQGGKRAFTHDSGVQTDNGLIVCRMLSATELSWRMPQTQVRFAVHGEDVLVGGIENGSVPPECEALLRETTLLDPGAAPAIAAAAAAQAASAAPDGSYDQATAVRNIVVEQTAWYSLRQPGVDHGPLLAYSGIAGTLPATFAVSPAAQPWSPMHLDWEVEYLPSPNGEQDWSLGEIDYTLNADAVIPKAGSGLICQGRAALTGGASNALATAVANAMAQASSITGTGPVPVAVKEAYFSQISAQLMTSYQTLKMSHFTAPSIATQPTDQSATQAPDQSALLTDISTALAQMDVLSCGLNGLMTQLRAGIPGDGVSTADGAVPTPFFAMRGGFLRIKRLRLVDGFGQFVDLCQPSATQDAQGFLVSAPLTVPTQSGVLGLPPRFTAPVCAWFRYMSADPSQPTVEADFETSPLCAFLMPNHLEGSIECFNADGSGAGSIVPNDDGTVGWQVAPGLNTAAGQDPFSTLKNSYAANLARGLIDWGLADAGQDREAALSAILRCIDSTLWAVDPFGHQGDEHLSLLLGHPVCVMRGLLQLQLKDPVTVPDNTVMAVPIRLGNLTQWVDGLLGYYMNDDYSKLYVADAAAADFARAVGPGQGFLSQINLVPGYYDSFANDLPAGATSGSTPVTHPYVDTSGVLWIRPNQTVNLTLLVEPLSTVHATAGLAPRKEIGMRRDWVSAGLAAIAPTFRFGPVLVDPKHIRMPISTDLSGTWVWDYRAAATQWAESPTTNATDDALLPQYPPSAMEGWLKLQPPPAKPDQGDT